jgi:TIR domain
MSESRAPRKKIFVSYSHQDEAWFNELKKRLLPMQRVHGFEIWDDKHLKPGQDWHAEIQKALGETKVALLMVSPGFMASEYIDKHELAPLKAAHERGEGVTVVPLHVSSADVDDYPFITKLQALNDPKRSLERLKEKPADLDDEFVAISRKIKALMQAPAAASAASGSAVAAPAVRRAEPRAPTPAASDEPGDDVDHNDGDEEGDGIPMAEMFSSELIGMFEQPGQQAMVVAADDGEDSLMLLMLTEGADDNLICEIAANDELPADLRLDKRAIRTLIEAFGFAEPQVRGDRLWRDLGPIDDIDTDELGGVLAELVEQGFGVPNDDLQVVTQVFDV